MFSVSSHNHSTVRSQPHEETHECDVREGVCRRMKEEVYMLQSFTLPPFDEQSYRYAKVTSDRH